MMIRDVISTVFLVTGFVFTVLSTIGVLRLPDFFTRLHSSSIGETLGVTLIGIGLMIYSGINLTSAKILMIVLAIYIVNPVGTHLIGKSALISGHTLEEEE